MKRAKHKIHKQFPIYTQSGDGLQLYHHSKVFKLESGYRFKDLRLGYHTYGTLNASGDNVTWVFHALTANSDPKEWWGGIFDKNKAIDPKKQFVVCVNIPGSCYGSSGPLDIDPKKNRKYYHDFPLWTMRDHVRAFQLLRDHLGIKKIQFGIGGSMGACHALEWALMEPKLIKKMLLIGFSAKETAWGKAIHTAHRLAIEADPTWQKRHDDAGLNGLKAARAFGMVVYRSHECFNELQDDDQPVLGDYKAESYQRYQALKLIKRFNAFSYHSMLQSLDTHHIGRGRKSIAATLKKIKAEMLIVGIKSDLLYPVSEMKKLHSLMPKSRLSLIESTYGHDGFLTEVEQINKLYKKYLA